MARTVVVIIVALVFSISWSAEAAAKTKAAKHAGATLRLCQSYRIQKGVPVKIGSPHVCREPRQLRLSLAMLGGAMLPE